MYACVTFNTSSSKLVAWVWKHQHNRRNGKLENLHVLTLITGGTDFFSHFFVVELLLSSLSWIDWIRCWVFHLVDQLHQQLVGLLNLLEHTAAIQWWIWSSSVTSHFLVVKTRPILLYNTALCCMLRLKVLWLITKLRVLTIARIAIVTHSTTTFHWMAGSPWNGTGRSTSFSWSGSCLPI